VCSVRQELGQNNRQINGIGASVTRGLLKSMQHKCKHKRQRRDLIIYKALLALHVYTLATAGRQRASECFTRMHACGRVASSLRGCGSGCAASRGRQAEEEVSVLLQKASDGHRMQTRHSLAPCGCCRLRQARRIREGGRARATLRIATTRASDGGGGGGGGDEHDVTKACLHYRMTRHRRQATAGRPRMRWAYSSFERVR
jgi:hypothetical protein